MKHLSLAVLALAIALFAQNSFSIDEQKFIDAYLHGKIDQIALDVDENISFNDSVMYLTGKRQYVEGLKQVFKMIPRADFTLEKTIRSGNDYLAIGALSFDYLGEALGHPGKLFKFNIPFSIALTVVNGKVTRHVDYVDGESFNKQLEQQINN